MNKNWHDYVKKIGVFIFILITVLILIKILMTFFSIGSLTITDILLFIVVILTVYLLISGDIREFTWGSLSIKMREIERENMGINSKEIKIQNPTEVKKGNEEFLFKDLPEIIKKNPHNKFILIITRRTRDERYYGSGVISLYLNTNFFDYVVFVDNQKYNAFIPASKLLGMIHLRQNEIENMINEWRINEIPGVITESLNAPVTIGCLSNVLENKNLREIAIVDKDRKILSIVTKEQAIEQIVTKLSSK